MSYYDPYVPVVRPTREYPQYEGRKSVDWKEDVIRSFDAVVISTNHKIIEYGQLAEWSECIVNTRNAMNGMDTKHGNHIFKA